MRWGQGRLLGITCGVKIKVSEGSAFFVTGLVAAYFLNSMILKRLFDGYEIPVSTSCIYLRIRPNQETDIDSGALSHAVIWKFIEGGDLSLRVQ